MWYFLALLDLCILAYLRICNDGGHVKGILVHLVLGFMINFKTRVQLLVVECNSRLAIIINTCKGFSFVFVTVLYFVGSSQTE